MIMGFVKKVLEDKQALLKGDIERMQHNLELVNLKACNISKDIAVANEQLEEINQALEAYQCEPAK